MAILCDPLGEIQRRRNGHGESDDGISELVLPKRSGDVLLIKTCSRELYLKSCVVQPRLSIIVAKA